MEAGSGDELYGYNADTAMAPASMTKVMAVYAVYDAMERGSITKDTVITIGPALAEYSRNPEYSNVRLGANTGYSLDELLQAVFVVSANAAIMAIGDYLYGSETNFVARMNQFVSDWGINARFADCTGVSPNNRVSPRAMASIANRLVTDYPDCLSYSSRTSINFRGQTYYATNKLLRGKNYDYIGAVGLKTGTTSAAGACLTAVAERGGIRLISVVMGAPYSDARYTDSIRMLDYAFNAAANRMTAPEPNAHLIEAYVNDMPIPAFYEEGNESVILVRIEDLSKNGFDVSYEENGSLIYAVNNDQRESIGHTDMSADGLVISARRNTEIVLRQNPDDYGMCASPIYDISGKAAIDIRDLAFMGWVKINDGKAIAVTR